MHSNKPQKTELDEDDPPMPQVRGDFTMPLASARRGRLVFASGASTLRIGANLTASELYSAHFEAHIPSVRVHAGIITIQYRRYLLFDRLAPASQPLAQIMLNATIPWEIEFRNGVSNLTADLRELHLCALDMGSVSKALLLLPAPDGVANVYLFGSASDLMVHRPPGIALRVQIRGTANNVTLDDQHFGATERGINWQSHDYHDASNRYEIDIAGNASHVIIGSVQRALNTIDP